jgi:hypothetical protein
MAGRGMLADNATMINIEATGGKLAISGQGCHFVKLSTSALLGLKPVILCIEDEPSSLLTVHTVNYSEICTTSNEEWYASKLWKTLSRNIPCDGMLRIIAGQRIWTSL